MNKNNNYEDLLYLPHPVSNKHPQMRLYDRAAQFSPFAALTGHDEAMKQTQRQAEYRVEYEEIIRTKEGFL